MASKIEDYIGNVYKYNTSSFILIFRDGGTVKNLIISKEGQTHEGLLKGHDIFQAINVNAPVCNIYDLIKAYSKLKDRR